MRWVRKTIEKDRTGAKFPYAKMYGDWLQHNELNNSFVLSILDKINERFAMGLPVDLIVPHFLGLAELRQELIQLFDSVNANDELLQTGSLWMRFGGLFLEEISNCPVGFTNALDEQKSGKAKAIMEQILSRSIQHYGDPGKGQPPPWFDRLVIEPESDSSGHFLWRLEFALPNGSRLGVRGRVLFVDPNPFRVNDLGLNSNSSMDEKLGAVDEAIEENFKIGRWVPLDDLED